MKIYALIPLFATLGLVACGDSDDSPEGGGMSGGSAGAGTGGASSGGSSSKGSGGAASGGTSTGSGGSGGGLGELVDFACTSEDGMGCEQYHGPSTPVASMSEACEMEMGTVGTMCPANPTGACSVMTAGIGFTFNYYTTDADELADAEMVCTSTGGTWSVP